MGRPLQIEQRRSGSAQPQLPAGIIKRFTIQFPDLLEQKLIVRCIKTAFNRIDHLAFEANSARALIDHCNEAVLVKAFRGKLVPQDPNDEPASVLLERIRAERQATGSLPRRKQRGKALSQARKPARRARTKTKKMKGHE